MKYKKGNTNRLADVLSNPATSKIRNLGTLMYMELSTHYACIKACIEDDDFNKVFWKLLEKYLPHPMQSYREGLIPFPHADLLSLMMKSKDKNIIFSTCTHLASYTTSVYTGFSTTTPIHRDLCQKIKIKCRVSMSQ
jgi:hypothetical protein